MRRIEWTACYEKDKSTFPETSSLSHASYKYELLARAFRVGRIQLRDGPGQERAGIPRAFLRREEPAGEFSGFAGLWLEKVSLPR